MPPTGWCAWATAPPNRRADEGRARRLWPYFAEISTAMRSTSRPPPRAWARAGPTWATTGAPSSPTSLADAGLALPAEPAFRSTGKRGRTASTSATSWPRCSICSAPFPGRVVSLVRVVSRLRAAWAVLDGGARSGGAGGLGARPRHRPRRDRARRRRSRSSLTPTYSGCPATEVIEASIVDAPRGEGPRPGAGGDVPRPGLDHRLDERERPPPAARLRHRPARAGVRTRRRRRCASCRARPGRATGSP